MSELDVHPTELDKATITTREQAVAWAEELTVEMLHWRQRCNVFIPGNINRTAVEQRRAMWTFLSKQGQLTGALKTLMLVGLLPERAYAELNQKAINALAPEVVGQMQ